MNVMATSQLSNADIADALKRARELAAGQRDESVKRPHEHDSNSDGEIPSKRANHMDMAGNPITALGGGLPGMDPVVIEQYEVPDSCVGLIIGRGGESISNIQNQTGCRVQMSQSPYTDQEGKSMRGCTLTGSKPSIEKAKELIEGIIEKSGGTPPPNRGGMPSGGGGGGMNMGGAGGRVITHEMLIPASKCGLVIGKGGETIKGLQEKAGVKMVMIQDSNISTGMPKPLRIIGEPDKVEFAKRLVEDVMLSKDDGSKGPGMMNDYGAYNHGGGKSIGEVMIIVPRTAVGVIIGRGGENIRRLTQDTGAKIQFKTGEDQNAPERTAVIQGTPEQIQKATQLITDMVNRAVAGGGEGGVGGGGGGGGFRKGAEPDIFYMHVPATKTGLVIGKGGETIKQICAESGARVELSRDPPPNDMEKVFVIRGSPQQIHHSQHLIRIRVGDVPANTPVPPFTGVEQQFGYPNYGNQTVGDPNAAAWAAYYQQYYQQGAAAATQYGQNYTGAAGGGAAQPTPANTASTAPTINPQTGQPDYSAQWAEYYRSLGMHEQATMIEQQARANQQNAAVVAAAASPAQAAPVNAQNYAYGQQQAQYGYGQQQAAGAPANAGGYQYPTQY